MRFVAAFLIGPGEADRHLARCLASARGWADLVLAYGDDPDPATISTIVEYADRARFGRENLFLKDEVQARDNLFDIADRYLDPGDIVFLLDADEQVAQEPQEVRRRLSDLPAGESWQVSFLHLWNDEGTMYRSDGAWYPSTGCRIYRHRVGMKAARVAPGSWVCHPLPKSHMWPATPRPILDILHWSYARQRDRLPKYRRYMELTGHSSEHVRSIMEVVPVLRPVPERF